MLTIDEKRAAVQNVFTSSYRRKIHFVLMTIKINDDLDVRARFFLFSASHRTSLGARSKSNGAENFVDLMIVSFEFDLRFAKETDTIHGRPS